ncbi:MAG: ABC transporter ATP-binding protein [Candidatus Omnitrophica bacterium]|nr:ABC transporter ATP-binding protein [Candidatus Omnitrophota bacterium]
MLKIENVSKRFFPDVSYRTLLLHNHKPGKPIVALDNISFDQAKGSTLAILGPNGAGKTTLLKIIATLILADSGQVKINGYQAGIDDEKIKSILGLISGEERSFYWRLSGRQNLEFFASLYGLGTKYARKKISQLLDYFCVDYANQRFDSYSSGMKKRFSLMRGLLHDPQLILLDEPTENLDYASALDLRKFIKETLVNKLNKTVIFTTHNLQEANFLSNRFLILHKGRLCALGSLDELRKKVNNNSADLEEIFLKLTQGLGKQ